MWPCESLHSLWSLSSSLVRDAVPLPSHSALARRSSAWLHIRYLQTQSQLLSETPMSAFTGSTYVDGRFIVRLIPVWIVHASQHLYSCQYLEMFSRHRAFNKLHICHPSLWRKYPARYISPSSSSQNHTQLLRVLWTDPLRMWMRSVLYLRGVSSALRTCRASSTFPSSRYSRYFCCRSRNFIRCRGAKTKTRI